MKLSALGAGVISLCCKGLCWTMVTKLPEAAIFSAGNTAVSPASVSKETGSPTFPPPQIMLFQTFILRCILSVIIYKVHLICK